MMQSWGMGGPWMLIPLLVMLVMFGLMRHHWWSGTCGHRHERRHQRDTLEREALRTPQDRDRIEELEQRVAELESGLDFAERLLVSHRESRGWPDHQLLDGSQRSSAPGLSSLGARS